MKLADLLNAYAEAAGERMLHRVGVAEMLVQLIESSRDSRMAAMEQFRTSLVGYVNESIDLMKQADMDDKNELSAGLAKLVAELHADRRDILAGDPDIVSRGEGKTGPDTSPSLSGSLEALAADSGNMFVKRIA